MTTGTRITAPRPPDAPPPFQFPIVATIAPVLAAVVLWAITRSPFTLVFAALGPVIAIASLADSRLSARRSGRRAAAQFAADLAATAESIERAHRAERAALDEQHPDARVLLARGGADPSRWRRDSDALLALGRSTVPSAAELEVVPGSGEPAKSQLLALGAHAAALADAPVVVDASAGIGVCGPPGLATAVARGLAMKLAHRLAPDRWWCGQSGHDWAGALPHPPGPPTEGDGIRFGTEDRSHALIAIAEREEDLPAGCGIVLTVGGGGAARITWHPNPAMRIELSIEAVAEPEAIGWALATRAEAMRTGVVRPGDALPGDIALGALGTPAQPAPPDGLAAVVAIGEAGPLEIDLVAHGPHAVVGGTTGSGKSELLVAWVVALAARYPPSALSFLLVDFKGGAAFAPLAVLPHTTGTITDLDAAGTMRALASLRAEVRHRERAIASAGARDITGVGGLGRLVIMVDEFAAMLAEHPDLHALFTDLAARGRSLGIHLVLCTQRPSGAVRDAVLANADLRISLRVNNRADSTAVIGTDAAASIPAPARGRALVALAGGEPVLVQLARAAESDIVAACARWEGSARARRPWIEPLPALVRLADLDPGPPGSRTFGLLDRPDEQRREMARWTPAEQGNLLVLGGPGAGASTALSSVAEAGGGEWLPAAVEPAWDAVAQRLGAPFAGVLVMDDLDALVGRFPPEHRTEFVDRLVRLAREGPATGTFLAAAMRRIPGELQVFASLLPARLLLRFPSRQDLVLAGGDGATHDSTSAPGAGTWFGARVQVGVGTRRRPPDPAAAVSPLPHGRPLAVVSTRAVAVGDSLARAGYRLVALDTAATDALSPAGPALKSAVIGDVDEWQARWGALAALRPIASVVFDGCSVSDLRQLARTRQLPPPLAVGQCWLLQPDGAVSRTVLPAGAALPGEVHAATGRNSSP